MIQIIIVTKVQKKNTKKIPKVTNVNKDVKSNVFTFVNYIC